MTRELTWTPDQPLRPDATDAQIDKRIMWCIESARREGIYDKYEPYFARVAREFAAACVAALHAPQNPCHFCADIHKNSEQQAAIDSAALTEGQP